MTIAEADPRRVRLESRRIVTKWYGRRFLRSLPEVPVEIEDDGAA
jgi:Rad3-related DNA helicase